MEVLSLGAEYFIWHYTGALSDIWAIWGNVLWFLYHFFSIPLLLRTFFSPWRRIAEGYQKGLHVQQFFETLIVNSLMRIVGMVFRLAVILVGFFSLACALAFGIAFFIFWLLLPLFLVTLFLLAFRSFSYIP